MRPGLTWDLRAVRLAQPIRLWRCRYGEAERDRADVQVDPQAEFSLGPTTKELRDTLPTNSLTVYSGYQLGHGSPGVIAE